MGYKRKAQSGRKKQNRDADRRRHGAARTRPLGPRREDDQTSGSGSGDIEQP